MRDNSTNFLIKSLIRSFNLQVTNYLFKDQALLQTPDKDVKQKHMTVIQAPKS